MPRFLRAWFGAALLLLAGCATATHVRVEQAAVRFGQVHGGMTRPQVVALVGEPQSVDAAGRAHWAVDDGERVAELMVGFVNDRVGPIWRWAGPVGRSTAMIAPGPGKTPFPEEDHWDPVQSVRIPPQR